METDVVIMKMLTDPLPVTLLVALQKGDPICGRQLFDTEEAFDVAHAIGVNAKKAAWKALNEHTAVKKCCRLAIAGFCVWGC